MGTIYGSRFSIQWGNPYTEPPDGMDRVQYQEIVYGKDHRRRVPASREHRFRELGGPGSGWSCCWDPVASAPKTRPLMSKQRQRRKNLWKRCQKYPLFQEQFYKEEVARRRDYYGVHTLRIQCPPK